MKPGKRILLMGCGILVVACLGGPSAVRGQAPAGPLPAAQSQDAAPPPKPQNVPPPVPPRTSIVGAWQLNPDDSDDPRKKMQDARGGGQQGPGGGHGGVHMGIPGIGNGPYGGHHGGGQSGESDEDRERMRDLFNPANSLTIAQKDAEVDVSDDQGRKLALFTDGRKVEKSKDEKSQEIAAKWESNRLVTEEKSPRGGKMSRTYELSYDGKQLYETLLLPAGRSSGSVSIRYVYDAVAGNAQGSAQSKSGSAQR